MLGKLDSKILYKKYTSIQILALEVYWMYTCTCHVKVAVLSIFFFRVKPTVSWRELSTMKDNLSYLETHVTQRKVSYRHLCTCVLFNAVCFSFAA